jgi:hypothetical protein
MVEVGRDAKSMLYSPSQSTVRVLLRESQLDYFVGEIEETVNVTRVHIKILYDMDVQACAAQENEFFRQASCNKCITTKYSLMILISSLMCDSQLVDIIALSCICLLLLSRAKLVAYIE